MDAEINIDALPSMTHHYGGHAWGNLPSMENKERISHPKKAALQSLEKMYAVSSLGVPQMVFPPHFRPDISTLRSLGFSGSDEQVASQAFREAPEIAYKLCSSAGMWMANAATVSAAPDTENRKIHFTPANLAISLHRAIETTFTTKLLQKAFPDPNYFHHHLPLPFGQFFSDEGAANVLRFSSGFNADSLTLFSWGKKVFDETRSLPKRFPARQSLEACTAVCRQHTLAKPSYLFIRQSPAAIDAGCFHLDLAATAHKAFFFFHERAFLDPDALIETITPLFFNRCSKELTIRKVTEKELPFAEALDAFLFNSQFVTCKEGKEWVFCSDKCRKNQKVRFLLEELLENPNYPIDKICYLDLSESLMGGGGPGCLRLRVPLSLEALEKVHTPLLFTETLYEQLKKWIKKYYPDSLRIEDLKDPSLMKREKEALDELTQMLQLGSIYSFQQSEGK